MSTSLFPVHGGGGTLGVLLMINGLRIHYCMFERILPLACTHHPLTRNLDSQNTHPPKKNPTKTEREDRQSWSRQWTTISALGLHGSVEREKEREREKMGWIALKNDGTHGLHVCVCVWERERERERSNVLVAEVTRTHFQNLGKLLFFQQLASYLHADLNPKTMWRISFFFFLVVRVLTKVQQQNTLALYILLSTWDKRVFLRCHDIMKYLKYIQNTLIMDYRHLIYIWVNYEFHFF